MDSKIKKISKDLKHAQKDTSKLLVADKKQDKMVSKLKKKKK